MARTHGGVDLSEPRSALNPIGPRTREVAVASSAVLEQEASAPETVPGGHDTVGRYLNEVGRYPLLDRDGEARLATAVQAGIRAREQLSQPGEPVVKCRRQLEQTIQAGQRAIIPRW